MHIYAYLCGISLIDLRCSASLKDSTPNIHYRLLYFLLFLFSLDPNYRAYAYTLNTRLYAHLCCTHAVLMLR